MWRANDAKGNEQLGDIRKREPAKRPLTWTSCLWNRNHRLPILSLNSSSVNSNNVLLPSPYTKQLLFTFSVAFYLSLCPSFNRTAWDFLIALIFLVYIFIFFLRSLFSSPFIFLVLAHTMVLSFGTVIYTHFFLDFLLFRANTQ